ncbi:MAG: ParA family protein [Clostridia bacterium]|nr:ParA family protein [Clostridia bacterium]
MSEAIVIAVSNQKGGVGKTTTTENFAFTLAEHGKRVLMVDFDAQASLTQTQGISQPDNLNHTVYDLMADVINGEETTEEPVMSTGHKNVDLLPANIDLAALETALVTVNRREHVLRMALMRYREQYDYILIDCQPSLGLLTINAWTAADEVLIVSTPQIFSSKGLEQLFGSIRRIQRYTNPRLTVAGVLMTRYTGKSKINREVMTLTEETYGEAVRIFEARIPTSVKVDESHYMCVPIVLYDPKGKVAAAYRAFCREYLGLDGGAAQ